MFCTMDVCTYVFLLRFVSCMHIDDKIKINIGGYIISKRQKPMNHSVKTALKERKPPEQDLAQCTHGQCTTVYVDYQQFL